MSSMTNPRGLQSNAPAAIPHSGEQEDERNSRIFQYALWGIAVVIFVLACVIVHFHPAPWPFDLQTTITIQHLHLWAGFMAVLTFASLMNDPLVSLIEYISWFVILMLIGIIAWRLGKAAVRWFMAGIFVSVGTGIMDGLNGLASLLVGRPRPSSPLIHVYMPEPYHSFPSGHAENDLVFYGMLLYLSFTPPVRHWRYRWILIPFQLVAFVIIAVIGYSRILEGSHWLTDVLGGYLSGAIFLSLLIFLYNHTFDWIRDRLARKQAEKHQRAYQATK
ncbi:MAG TPA: phosphatase PAP2 family protein [Ktedonobacteraceae bacterium]|jgi:membrane-associated phospholipid phosphatase|nr:phosphatase PAP2 family protein [Ktedonobacteraceae bacterium]